MIKLTQGTGEYSLKYEKKLRNHERLTKDRIMENKTVDLLIKFKLWYDGLSPSQKVSVWSEDGSAQGLFNLSDQAIIEKFINQLDPGEFSSQELIEYKTKLKKDVKGILPDIYSASDYQQGMRVAVTAIVKLIDSL